MGQQIPAEPPIAYLLPIMIQVEFPFQIIRLQKPYGQNREHDQGDPPPEQPPESASGYQQSPQHWSQNLAPARQHTQHSCLFAQFIRLGFQEKQVERNPIQKSRKRNHQRPRPNQQRICFSILQTQKHQRQQNPPQHHRLLKSDSTHHLGHLVSHNRLQKPGHYHIPHQHSHPP